MSLSIVRWSAAGMSTLTFICLCVGCSLATPRDVWDTHTKTSMIIYFRPGTSGEEMGAFDDSVLMVPSRTSGYDFAGGIIGTMACSGPRGVDAICVDFARGASRDEIRTRAQNWPTVLRVLEDVAPADVKPEDIGL
jgi:hypothetical protein